MSEASEFRDRNYEIRIPFGAVWFQSLQCDRLTFPGALGSSENGSSELKTMSVVPHTRTVLTSRESTETFSRCLVRYGTLVCFYGGPMMTSWSSTNSTEYSDGVLY